MKKIDKFIKFFLSGNIYLDEYYMTNLITCYAKENDLEDFVEKITISSDKLCFETPNISYYLKLLISNYKKYQAMYLPNNLELLINKNRSDYMFNLYYRELGLDYNEKEMIKIYNLYFILIILHELEHANQLKLSFSDEKDGLTSIIKESIELGKRSPNNLTWDEVMLYKFHYFSILAERNAELGALDTILKIDEEENQIIQRVKIDLVNKYNKLLLKGYKNTSPLEEYYKLRKKDFELESLEFKDDYDLFTRVSWGLPESMENVKRLILK